MNIKALFSPYLYFICTYFVIIFYIYPELTTVNRCVKSPLHFENIMETVQKMAWSLRQLQLWLASYEKCENKAIVLMVRVSAL